MYRDWCKLFLHSKSISQMDRLRRMPVLVSNTIKNIDLLIFFAIYRIPLMLTIYFMSMKRYRSIAVLIAIKNSNETEQAMEIERRVGVVTNPRFCQRLQNKNKKSNLHYTRGITPKRVTSGGIHLREFAPGLYSSEETSQQRRAIVDTEYDVNDSGIEPQTSSPMSLTALPLQMWKAHVTNLTWLEPTLRQWQPRVVIIASLKIEFCSAPSSKSTVYFVDIALVPPGVFDQNMHWKWFTSRSIDLRFFISALFGSGPSASERRVYDDRDRMVQVPPNLVVASLDQLLPDDYFCSVESNKQQIKEIRSKIQAKNCETKTTPQRVWIRLMYSASTDFFWQEDKNQESQLWSKSLSICHVDLLVH